MRKVALGAVIGLLASGALMYLYLRLGFLDFRADVRPSQFETKQAMAFLDASVGRRVPHGPAPETSEQGLLEGVKLYKTYCEECHGSPERAEQKLAPLPFYPPPPQFMENAPDMPECENFYIIQHGIRWTGMPAWRSTLTAKQIWEVADFLGHMDKLPLAVEQEWHSAAPNNVTPGTATKREK